MGLLPKGRAYVRVAQQSIVRDPGVRIADQKPAREPHEISDFAGTPQTGLGKPRQGTHLSSLRTTHRRVPEGAFCRRF
jgi:hypothetical protein